MRINATMKPRSGGGPTSVLIPALSEYQRPYPKNFTHLDISFIWERIEYNNGEDVVNWERVTDQKKVESMILSWQRQHFTQANETPFAKKFWHKELPKKLVQESILDGTYKVPKDLPTEAQEILHEMKRPDDIESSIEETVSLGDFKDYIKKSKNLDLLRLWVGTMDITKSYSRLTRNFYM